MSDPAALARHRWRLRSDLLPIVIAVIVWRLVLGAVMLYADVHVAEAPGTARWPGLSPALQPTVGWDSAYYYRIAEAGYTEVDGHLAFFPLFPLLVSGVSGTIGLSPAVAALLLNLVATMVACWALFELARDYLGSRDRSWQAVALFLFFPASFFLAVFYTESLFCALTFTALLAARKRRWHWAAVLAGASTAVRLPGLITAAAVVVEYLSARRVVTTEGVALRNVDRQALWFLLLPVGVLGYLLFLYQRFGDPLAFLGVYKTYWPYQVLEPNLASTVVAEIRLLLRSFGSGEFDRFFTELFSFGAWTVAAAVLALRWRALPASYRVFIGLSLVLFALNSNFTSTIRYVLPLFPIYLVAVRSRYNTPLVYGLWLGLSAMLMGVLLTSFANKYWAG